MEDYFERDIQTVQDFYNKHRGKSEDHLAIETRAILLSGISKTRVGVYSKFHDNATYHLGYNHPTTIRLAYMYESLSSLHCYILSQLVAFTQIYRFTTCLDSGKSGLHVNTRRFREDQRTWDYPLPDCMKKGEDYVENRKALRPASNYFVLDMLVKKGEEIRNQHLKKYEENKERVISAGGMDPSLIAPIARALEQIGPQSRPIHSELMELQMHVERVRGAWRVYWASKPGRRMALWSKAGKSTSRLADTRRIEELRGDFISGPDTGKIRTLLALDPCLVPKLRASIAAGSSGGGSSDRFAFAMAYETLLAIKAEASGGTSPIARSFGDILGVSPAIGRFYSQ